ncbi:MAG: cation:proton antiporter [Candidatus Methanofastidiosa archaeon]|nr:cation:proton antiporter [Candidatus Methanofastidiosa archaeon]
MIELIDIVLLLFVAKVLGELFSRMSISSIVAEVLTGICLGPFILNIVAPTEAFNVLAELGLLMMMLYVGLTSKYTDLSRSKFSSSVIGSLGVIASFGLGFAFCYAFGFGLLESVFLGILLSNTSIEVVSGMIINEDTQDMGPVLVASALADDFIAIYLIGVLSAIANTGALDMATFGLITIKIVVFLFAVLYISDKILVKDIFKLVSMRFFRSDYQMLSVMFILTFSLALLANALGLHEIIGAYLAGLVIGRVREFKDPMLNVQVTLNENIEHLGVTLKSIFMPFFFISIGLSFNPVSGISVLFIVIISVAAFGGKMLGCGLGAYLSGFNKGKAILIGVGMCGRGSLELALVNYGYNSGVIGEDVFTTIIIVSLMTIILTPLLFKWGLSRLARYGAFQTLEPSA